MQLPDPRKNPFLSPLSGPGSGPRLQTPAARSDAIMSMERTAARRAALYERCANPRDVHPARWHRPEPRPSIQYAGHMSTQAARDARLARGAVSLLLVLRARAGHGTQTDTTKTTLANVLRVSVRTVGRWLRDLRAFGYIDARGRVGRSGLTVGLSLRLCEKVFPAWRDTRWLSAWLATCSGSGLYPQNGGNPGRTFLSYKNHSIEKSEYSTASP